MKNIVLLMICLLGKSLFAQYQDMSFSKPGKMNYQELSDPATTKLEEWRELENDINVSFADDNVRYAKKKCAKGWITGKLECKGMER
jgi:hypothetical protein